MNWICFEYTEILLHTERKGTTRSLKREWSDWLAVSSRRKFKIIIIIIIIIIISSSSSSSSSSGGGVVFSNSTVPSRTVLSLFPRC
jgi:hypothetical protein